MSDDAPNEFHTGAAVPFRAGTGYVGLNTLPGVASEPVTGLRFDAESYLFNEETVENVWLLATLAANPDGLKEEFLMYADRAETLEPVVAAITEAALGRGRKEGLAIPGSYEGYHNQAQVAASDDVTEECRHGLGAEVRAGTSEGGFELALRDAEQAASYDRHRRAFSTGGADGAVMRLVAAMDGEAVSLLLGEFAKVKKFQAEMRNRIEAYVEANPTAPAMGR